MSAAMFPEVVFLDRDGVINEDSPAYVKSVDEFILIPGSIEAIAHLSQLGIKIIVITNQSGLHRNYFTFEILEAMHQKLRDVVTAAGGNIAGIFFCPHGPEEGCLCRKPLPGLVHQAEKTLSITASGQPFVGDSERDIECALAAGCTPVLVGTGNGIKAHTKFPNVPFYSSLAEYVHNLTTIAC